MTRGMLTTAYVNLKKTVSLDELHDLLFGLRPAESTRPKAYGAGPVLGGGVMRVCFLLHQGSMYSGGQGIYLHHITRELAELGHEVHVLAGPPYPDVAEDVIVHKIPNYSIYRLLETGRFFFFGSAAHKGQQNYQQQIIHRVLE